MSEKIARLGIERDNDLMYFIKNGAVWATPRKKPGQAKGKPRMIEDAGIEMDYSKYLYFLDSDGDVARKERAQGGGGRRSKTRTAKPTRAAKGAKPSRGSKPSRRGKAAPAEPARESSRNGGGSNGNGKKSEEEIAREVDECLAKARRSGALTEGETAAASAGARMRRHDRY